jgi:hypothetical protein
MLIIWASIRTRLFFRLGELGLRDISSRLLNVAYKYIKTLVQYAEKPDLVLFVKAAGTLGYYSGESKNSVSGTRRRVVW